MTAFEKGVVLLILVTVGLVLAALVLSFGFKPVVAS